MNLPTISRKALTAIFASLLIITIGAQSIDVKQTASYHRIKQVLDATPAIDTHDHLPPFDRIAGRVQTERGSGMNLFSLWQSSYYTWYNPLSAWPKSGKFEDWWPRAKHGFDNAHATSFYRYQLSAFADLYGVDFDAITDDQARLLNDRIFDHYRDRDWVYEVLTERANIELMVMDPYWNRLGFDLEHSFPWRLSLDWRNGGDCNAI